MTNASNERLHKIILWGIGLLVVVLGIMLFVIPPAIFADPANGFQVLQSMQRGGSFNNFVAPDQGDISLDYPEFLAWWSPGQYLVPYFFKLATHLDLGHAIAITVTLCTVIGLAGLYFFFKKIGFSKLISSMSLLFIVCQLAFFIPYAFYNGGEILLFAFMGWFLYGCASFEKPGVKMALFVLLAGWAGFFFKSSFIWMYFAGLGCLWIRLSTGQKEILQWIKKGLWIAIPAIIALATIYLFYLSKGESPATDSRGFKFTTEAFTYPLASPLLAGFFIDDLGHWLIYYAGKPLLAPGWNPVVLWVFALLSLYLVFIIIRKVPNKNYRWFVFIFYAGALLFFSYSYLRQLNISYEGRHFRVIAILIAPGIMYLVAKTKAVFKVFFMLICLITTSYAVSYCYNGFHFNQKIAAKGSTGIAQCNIDQISLNKIMQLDRENKHIIFVFVSNDIGLEILHNRIVTLQQINDDLKINQDDFTYEGFGGPLYIVLPESYSGPKEKMVIKSFPGYTGFTESMLSDKYVLYVSNTKK